MIRLKVMTDREIHLNLLFKNEKGTPSCSCNLKKFLHKRQYDAPLAPDTEKNEMYLAEKQILQPTARMRT
jgi:hypothetical protein